VLRGIVHKYITRVKLNALLNIISINHLTTNNPTILGSSMPLILNDLDFQKYD